MLQGTQDKLVKPQGSYDLFTKIKCPNKIFISLPSEHLILEIQDTHTRVFDQTVGNMITGWLKAQKAVLESRPPDDSRLVQTVVPPPEPTAPMPPVALAEPEQSVMPDGDADPMEREMTLALRSMRNNKFQEARKLLEAVVSAEPLNSDAHYWFALCLAHLGDKSRAREEKALAQALMKVTPDPNAMRTMYSGSRGAASSTTVAVNRQELTEGKTNRGYIPGPLVRGVPGP
ncbi:MAG: tetratricopeptide repeat protein [Candidatus Competibacteraceae bacterium]|nr:tetratricopeptide repeat protein [Candidatus Competibacteraceae bacterium]